MVEDDESVAGMNFEDESDDSESPEIAPENRVLRTQAYDKSVGDLVAMVKSEEALCNIQSQ